MAITNKLLLITLLVVLTSCASTLKKPAPPEVSLAGLDVLEMGLFEQKFLMKLRLQNSNDATLAIKGMNYEVFINNHPFAHGVSRNAVKIPAFGEDVIEVEVISTLKGFFEQFRNLGNAIPTDFNYRIVGNIQLGNWPVKIPFEHKGEFSPTTPKSDPPASGQQI